MVKNARQGSIIRFQLAFSDIPQIDEWTIAPVWRAYLMFDRLYWSNGNDGQREDEGLFKLFVHFKVYQLPIYIFKGTASAGQFFQYHSIWNRFLGNFYV